MQRGFGAVALVAVLAVAACTNEPAPGRSRERTAPRGDGGGRACAGLGDLVRLVRRGWVEGASPDISFIPREPNYVGTRFSPVHSGPWDYLTHVPLLLYGPGFIEPGRYERPATMADVAPTIARLVRFRRPPESSGRVLGDALTGTPRTPRVVVTIVWDGGGFNVLEAHPDAWPYLNHLSRAGAWFPRFSVGSSPSVTPPIHTTLGTGAFPRIHGIPGLRMRTTEGEIVDPFVGLDPSNIRVPALADLYDRARRNEPIVGLLGSSNWHLGMVGHGIGFAGGDRDLVALVDHDGDTYTNPALYSLPPIADPAELAARLRVQDRSDGRIDQRWNGRDIADELFRFSTPAVARYFGELLRRLLAQGFGDDRVPDLLFVNFKTSDEAGHRWGMTSEEVGLVLEAQDDELRRLVSVLNDEVGPRRWVIALTADHGQTPYPQESGGWAIAGAEVQRDLNARFDRDGGVPLVTDVVSAGAYVDRVQVRANGVTDDDIARRLASYTVGDNADGDIPMWYQGTADDPVFDALLTGRRVAATSCER